MASYGKRMLQAAFQKKNESVRPVPPSVKVCTYLAFSYLL